MFKLFKHLSIVQTTMLSVSFLIFFALTLSILSIYSSWQTLQLHDQDKRSIVLMDALEKVAHHHAVERGLTAGYLGAPTEAKKQALDKQRQQADAIVVTLNQLKEGPWPTEFKIQQHLSLLTEVLSEKTQIRRSVDEYKAPKAFAYYSKVNKISLDTLQILRMNIKGWQVQKSLSGAINLAWFKERAGQLRGKINGALAKGKIDPLVKAEISTYIEDLSLINHYLDNILEGERLDLFQQKLNNENSRLIKQVHSQIVQVSPEEFNANEFPTSGSWFVMATEQIGGIKGLLDQQWQQLHQQISEDSEQANFSLISEFIVLCVILVFVVLINLDLINSLRRNLAQLTSSLHKVAHEGDLTRDIRLHSNNELGNISNAINDTIYAFKVLIIGLADSVNTSTRLSNHINGISARVLNDAQSTQKLATNIATAVEQMAATGDQIAQSAASVLEASDALKQNAELTHKVNQHSRDAMQKLNDYMQVVESKANFMEQQVGTISGILDTINNLSEQTNLLALNAAIEAARAGESGRGFAVVADEVRTLAKSSKSSSDRIGDLLKGLQKASEEVALAIRNNADSTQDTLQRVEEAQQISDEMKRQSSKVEGLSHQVATAAEQQSTVAKEIASDANKVLSAADHELESAEEMLNVFEELKINNDVLGTTMKSFKID